MTEDQLEQETLSWLADVGYQPLMRDVLARFVPNALKEILKAEQEKATLANEKALLPERRKKVA